MRDHRRLLALRYVAVIAGAATAISLGPTPARAHTPANVTKERAHVKQRARSALGSPYRYGGTSKSGFDCSGFTMWTFDRHGASLPHNAMQQWNLAKRRGYRRVWKRSRLRRGDLVFHKTTSARVGHAGIYIGHGKFISATSSEGVRVRSIWDKYYWGPRYRGAVRVPALRGG